MPIKVLFLLPYPLHKAPSQRFRIEEFFSLLNRQSVSYDIDVFIDDNTWKVLYKGGSVVNKIWGVIKGFLKRFYAVLVQSRRYDFVFIHREASPIGPPIFEWMLARVFGKKIIFDFDDAIWIPAITAENRLAGLVKCFWKTKYICQWSYKVSAGNQFLASFAAQYCNQVEVVPTCVDAEKRFNQLKDQRAEKLVIGWTGSHSTLHYLDLIYPVLKRIEKEFDIDFLVICNKRPDYDLQSLRFIEWKEETEIEDLLQMNIGLMPLVKDGWSEGKCGFKIIQYLSLGIPAVASPVGVNNTIVEEGKNGFLCANDQDWYDALKILITDAELRACMGREGRQKIIKNYSIQSQEERFLSLIS